MPCHASKMDVFVASHSNSNTAHATILVSEFDSWRILSFCFQHDIFVCKMSARLSLAVLYISLGLALIYFVVYFRRYDIALTCTDCVPLKSNMPDIFGINERSVNVHRAHSKQSQQSLSFSFSFSHCDCVLIFTHVNHFVHGKCTVSITLIQLSAAFNSYFVRKFIYKCVYSI